MKKPDWADKIAIRCVRMSGPTINYRQDLHDTARSLRTARRQGYKRAEDIAVKYLLKGMGEHSGWTRDLKATLYMGRKEKVK